MCAPLVSLGQLPLHANFTCCQLRELHCSRYIRWHELIVHFIYLKWKHFVKQTKNIFDARPTTTTTFLFFIVVDNEKWWCSLHWTHRHERFRCQDYCRECVPCVHSGTGGLFICLQYKKFSLKSSVFYFVLRSNRSANFCTHSHPAKIPFIERPFFHFLFL